MEVNQDIVRRATEKAKSRLKQSWTSLAGRETIEGSSSRQMSVRDPYRDAVIAEFKCANADDLRRIATKAAAAQREWWSLERRERSRRMMQIAAITREHAEELAALETYANGKLFRESFVDDLPESAEVFEYYAGWCDKYYGETCPVGNSFLNYTLHEPHGVCGLLVPWNFPLLLACWKIAPAIAMGNSVIVKPSEYTPLSMVRWCELINAAGILPDGLINVLLGDAETGTDLCQSPLIHKLSFTGSTQVGRIILKHSADSNLKPVTLELGGKSPNIIFDDVPDLEAAIDRSFTAMFSHKAEKCSEPTRLLVHRDHYRKVLSGLADRAEKVVCGDPMDLNSHQGPQCHRQHHAKILSYLEMAKTEKLKKTCGKDPHGLFVPPTIFEDVRAESRLFQEEIFGPLLTVTPFSTDDEAIALANATPYGLAAGFWTSNISRAHRLATRIDAGMIFINRYGCYDFASPFGGSKQSGWGKEMAIHSLAAYTKTKSVWVKL